MLSSKMTGGDLTTLTFH